MNQPLTTALSEYYQTNSPKLQNGSLDFCNSFWGLDDVGVDVLFARMRGAAQTIEGLNVFWKERASIEEEYASRLAKLAEITLGRNEIGDLRKSLDAIRADTELQAEFHLLLARQLRSEFEVSTTAFHARQLHHKNTRQAGIEKLFKTKQAREFYFGRTRERYEHDCVRINVMEAQASDAPSNNLAPPQEPKPRAIRRTSISDMVRKYEAIGGARGAVKPPNNSLAPGRELEGMNFKFERAKITSQINEQDYLRFSMTLKETVIEWEQEWKSFCDTCQDMEEDRMNFMKDTFLNYANALSTVCAAADTCCQSMKFAFEEMEAENEVEIFVWEYGTGNQIPDPPHFVPNSAPHGISSSLAQPTSHIAEFIRSASRDIPSLQSSNDSLPLEEEPVANTTDVGDKEVAAFWENEPCTSESVIDTPPQPIATSSEARQIPDTHTIQLAPPMTNQNGGVEALKRLEEPQVSVSQNARRPLPNPPPIDSMVPTCTQPVGAAVAQASAADHQPMLAGEHTSLTLRNTSRKHSQSLSPVYIDSNPIPTATTRQLRQPVEVAGYSEWENGLQRSTTISATPESGLNEPQQQQMLTVQQQQMWAIQQHQMLVAQQQQLHILAFQWQQQQGQMVQLSQQLQRMDRDANPVWRSHSQSFPQVIDDVPDSDLAEESGGYYYSATDEPEGYEPEDHETEDKPDMPAMPPQMSGRLNLFLKQRRQHNSSNLNVNPLNFVIKKEMKSRRITHRPHSTSESSMKLDTDSFNIFHIVVLHQSPMRTPLY